MSIAVPGLDAVKAARDRIRPFILDTPIVAAAGVQCKLEVHQHTGSFKVRGAFNAALQLNDKQRAQGVVAVSGGNHGLAVAYVGKTLGIRAIVVMPSTTPDHVIERARADDATIVLTDSIAAAFEKGLSIASGGSVLLHPFDDEAVIAGQGTIGLEILEQYPGVKTLVVSIGGGGLISGIAATVKALKPSVTVLGVETRGADAMRLALDAGHLVTLPAITSIARTLGAPSVSERTFSAAKAFVDDVIVVEDREAVLAIVELQKYGLQTEPAASCTYAAIRDTSMLRADTVILLCGSNVLASEIEGWRTRFAV